MVYLRKQIFKIRIISMNHQLLEQDPKQLLTTLVKESQKMSLDIESLAITDYEQVLKITEIKSQLRAIIAIHSTVMGPALGGIRIYPYASFDDALEDVLRLAKGMTYKAAVSEVGFGGGKSVIIADPKTQKTPDMLLAFGAAVEKLQGSYICAEDVGCATQDCQMIRQTTKYIVGLPQTKSSGDPGPFTAYGVLRGIQSAAHKLFGSSSLEGRTVAVQGLGNVGANLAEFLFWAGANLILSDLDMAKAQRMAAKFGGIAVKTEEILSVSCDILAPCALGGIINDETLPQFHCKAIAGSANNQLLHDRHAVALKDRGILYAPDFVINAGGLLNVAAELEEDGYHPLLPRAKIQRIYDCLLAIYEIAEKNNDSTHAAAQSLAEYRIKYGIGKRLIPPTFHHTIE
jgi:leucine dehydrogenase